MKVRSRNILFSLITLSMFVISLVSPTVALADDSAPPETPPTLETQVPDQTGTAPADTVAAPESPVSVPEVLEQAPDDTTIVVVNDAGQVEPLATTAAAEILKTGDPMWCPAGTTPGGAGCTGSYGDLTTLIADLATDAALPTPIYGGQNGVIWVEDSYSGNDNSGINFDGTVLTTLNNHDLTIQGGWSGGANTTITGTSDFDVPLNITNWTSNVTLNNLSLVANDTYAALNVITTGNISVSNVSVTGNATGSGTNLDSCQYDGSTGLCVGTGDISVTNSQFNNNNAFGASGLVTHSAGNTTLGNVQANSNGLTGAYITGWNDGTGDVMITNSTFSGNVNGTGVDVLSDGNLTLANVIANGNNTGAILNTTPGAGSISVTGGHYNGNDYNGLEASSAGNITISNTDISSNSWDGADLSTNGIGDISVANSTFTENNSWGLTAVSNNNVTLNGVTVDGVDVAVTGTNVTDVGAALASLDGTVSVQNSTFTDNSETGLLVVAGKQVDLVTVTVTANLGDGAQVFSTYTYACFGSKGILVNVNGGTFAGNGAAGLFVMPGPEGTVVVGTPPIFTPANGSGDLVVDLGDPCQGKDEEQPEEGKGPNIVEVPFKGGEPVQQDCVNYSSTVLELPDGTWVKFGCPFEGYTVLEGLNEDELPGTLGAGADFVAGILAKMMDLENAEITFNKDGTITITFQIPEDSHARGYDILYWDPTANNGTGAWVTLPQSKLGQRLTPLNPNDPEDGRMIKRGVLQKGNTVSVTVNFTGTFVLVSR
jgi:hypothetical protein